MCVCVVSYKCAFNTLRSFVYSGCARRNTQSGITGGGGVRPVHNTVGYGQFRPAVLLYNGTSVAQCRICVAPHLLLTVSHSPMPPPSRCTNQSGGIVRRRPLFRSSIRVGKAGEKKEREGKFLCLPPTLEVSKSVLVREGEGGGET